MLNVRKQASELVTEAAAGHWPEPLSDKITALGSGCGENTDVTKISQSPIRTNDPLPHCSGGTPGLCSVTSGG